MDLLENADDTGDVGDENFEADIGYEEKNDEKNDLPDEVGGGDDEEDEEDDAEESVDAPGANMENKQKHAVKIIHIIPPEERKTSSIGSMFELSNMLGSRCAHIINGAPTMVDTTGLSTVGIILSEASAGKIPMGVFRTVRETTTERWVESWTFGELGWSSIPLKDPTHNTISVWNPPSVKT